MKFRDFKSVPHCTIDFPLEFTPDEISSLAGPINTLLKSTYLLGVSKDIDGTFQSIFDIAEEIAGIDRCAYIAGTAESDEFNLAITRHLTVPPGKEALVFTPAALASFFDKAVLLDAEKTPQFLSLCKAWSCKSLLAFPLRRDREHIGALVFAKEKSHPFTTVEVKLLWYLAMKAENRILATEAVKTLAFYSFLDPLTHLYNRRYFDDQIEKEIYRSRRNGKPFSLLMIDLDGFKAYNDRFLHSAGDIVLQEFATILRGAIREVDTVARFGGDEFALILAESYSDGARDLAARLADQLGNHLFPGIENERTERLTACIGIASFPSDSFDKQDLIQKADRALYLAKGQGVGKMCLYNEIIDIVSIQPTVSDIPIQKIYNAARSVVDMDKFLEILLFTAMQGLSASRGSIVVVDPAGNFTLRAAIGFNGEARLSLGNTVSPGAITSWVAEHKEPLLVSGQNDMPLPKELKKNGYRTDSFLSLPLLHEDRLIGVLHLTNKRDKQPFTRDDLAAFEPVSREIAQVLSQGIAFQDNLKSFSTSILQSLSSALELRFPFLQGHSQRVRDLSLRIGNRLALNEKEMNALGTAATMHDIGIVGIPGTILVVKRKLTERELDIARKHPFLGSKLLEGVPGLEDIRRIILEHQEFFDGSGYPFGLRGEEISLGARILSIAEFYDSITSERPHRGKLLPGEALQLIKNNSNVLFQPDVCRAFLEEMHGTDPLLSS